MCKECDKRCPICEEQTWETHTNLCRSCYMATERIIKLLEDRMNKGCSGYDCETCGEHEGLGHAIALIKGEQK